MSWGGPEFVVAIVAISTVGWLISTWIRAKHGYPVENEWSGMTGKGDPAAQGRIAELTNENAQLRAEIGSVKDRLETMERIVTDRPSKLAKEIDALAMDQGGNA
jgi:hypothetical protein